MLSCKNILSKAGETEKKFIFLSLRKEY